LPQKPLNTHTLLGIAPLPGTLGAKSAHHKTLLGVSPPAAAPLSAPQPHFPLPPAPLVATLVSEVAPIEPPPSALPEVAPVYEPVVQGAANVPGYAPKYTPKDGPATPAVVIAPEAQSSPEANKRPLSVTQPSRVRTGVASAPFAASIGDGDDIEDIYPRKRKTGLWIVLGLGAVVALIGAALGIRAMSGESAAPSSAATTPSAPASPRAASTTLPTSEDNAPAAPVVPTPTAAPSAPAPAATSVEAPEAPSPQAAVTRSKPVKSKAEPVAAPAPRATHAAATATFPAEQTTPTPKSGKSVIVRDAPF
jgi:hypothetical protein